MITTQYVNVDTVLEATKKQFPFTKDVTRIEASDYLFDMMKLMDVNKSLVADIEFVEIEHRKAVIPECVHSILTAGLVKKHPTTENIEVTQMIVESSTLMNLGDFGETETRATYKLNAGCIRTNFDFGTVMLVVFKLPEDKDGLALIPQEQSFINAAKFEIAHKVAFALWSVDAISDKVFNYVDSNKMWYFAQAVNKAKTLSIDEEESFKNQIIKSIPKHYEHTDFFKNLANPERRFIKGAFNNDPGATLTLSNFGIARP